MEGLGLGRYYINEASLARDAGKNKLVDFDDLDVLGNYRILNNDVDMGAFEFAPPCISHLVLDGGALSDSKLRGTWSAKDSITLLGDIEIDDLSYLQLNAPTMQVEGTLNSGISEMSMNTFGCLSN